MAKQETGGDENVKVVSVVWYQVLPPRFGGQKAVALFNEHLAYKTDLLCLCSKNNQATGASYKIDASLAVSKWQFISPFVWRKIFTTAKREKITHIILEFPYHGLAGFICKKLLGTKLITNTHNIEFLRFKEQKKWWWGLLYHYEKWTLKNSDTVFFKTEADKLFAQKYFGLAEEKSAVVPYGVKEAATDAKHKAQAAIRNRHTIAGHEKIILFAGTLDYVPNAEALLAIGKELIPLLNQKYLSYKIMVCGRNRLKEFQYLENIRNEKLIFAGEVEDIESYFLAADVFINPVLSGGGIQTKIMDALSYHLNVVCFESKCSSIANAANKLFCVEDGNWKAFASAIMEALKESEPTPQVFFNEYSWVTIAEDAYQKLIRL